MPLGTWVRVRLGASLGRPTTSDLGLRRHQGAKDDRYFRDRWEHPARALLGKASAVDSSAPQQPRWHRDAPVGSKGISIPFLRPAWASRHSGPSPLSQLQLPKLDSANTPPAS